MGSDRKQKRRDAPQPIRSRTTRSSKSRLLSDPTQNMQVLNDQLHSLGLYAASTLGDGNCLFRALSDQFYGTPSYHLKLRQDICDWIDLHKQRYEPFVEDERGLDVHLRCMRQQGTYGGHLELSAFAHLNRRDVKVMQPGLVYVIQWAAGRERFESTLQPTPDESQLNDREKRRLRREKRRSEADQSTANSDGPQQRPVYLAYYDWEHFDSIRNLKGPHTGIPNVVERGEDVSMQTSPAKTKRKSELKPASKASKKILNLPPVKVIPSPIPAEVPLPTSRSPSPDSALSDPPSSNLPSPYVYPALPKFSSLQDTTRVHRSPKRSFDESSASSQSETSESATKKPRSTHPSPSRLTRETEMDVDIEDTPGLSPSGFTTESSLSPLPSSVPSRANTPPPPTSPKIRLTKRQRKALGLSKARPPHVVGKGSGKIVIPGGKFKRGNTASAAKRASVKVEQGDEVEAEWAKNGTGRVDVRGFRELKI